MRLALALAIALALGPAPHAAPVSAQELEEDAPPVTLAARPPRSGSKAARKPPGKPASRTSAKKKPGSSAAAPRLGPIPDGALEALDQALSAFLTEKRAQPVVMHEPAEQGAELTVAIETLDQSLGAQLKKSARKPATPPGSRVTAGLSAVLEELNERGAPAGPGTPHTAELAPTPANQGPPIPDIPTTPPSPSPDVSTSPESFGPTPTPAAPETAPPPLAIAPEAAAEPPPASASTPSAPETAALSAPARRYVLSRIVVLKDGGAEHDLPVPQGALVRPVPLSHRGGSPPVEVKMLVRAPGEFTLGDSTQLAAQASAQAPGVAAELSLLDEVVDSVRAADGAETAAAAGTVSFSFVKKVGGVYGYQQTFAQGDGRSAGSTPARSILLNWTDRDPVIEMPFAWATTSPSALSVRGRLVYSPATRP